MAKIELKINGQEITAQPGQTILEVVREQGIDKIPTLCHSDELKPYGSCFLCTVEVKGRGGLVPSCATKVTPGMEVETRNDRVTESRRTALELLLSNHYADCVSPCMEGCPAGVDVQGYLALAGMGEVEKAVELIRRENPLPAVCGRVCVRRCEDVCRRADVDEAVGINWVKRHLVDQPGIYDQDPEREPDRGKSVGIIGGGPAGLTTAFYLGRKGYKPVIYEANEKAGGMVRYGIPNYRLPDDVLDREIDYICRAGAEIHYNTRVGKDVTLENLRKDHDALFLGAGAWTGKAMRVEGEFETEGVVTGADFLPPQQRSPQKLKGTVVVVGGGNTAMDCARTSWRCGADKVIVLYRRTKAQMPADKMEIVDLLEEGIELMELAAPIGIVKEGGRLKALRCIRMKLGEPDSSGRRRPVTMEGSEFDLPCELAISAIGQDTVLDGIKEVGGEPVELTRWNTYVADEQSMATNLAGVFAGGDSANDGPTVVIDAIRDGKRAADAIHAWLSGEAVPPKPFVVTKDMWAKPGKTELGDVTESPRHDVDMIEVEERENSFAEVATGFSHEDKDHEVSRCLSCGCVRFDDCDLRLYAEEYGVDMGRFNGYVRKHKPDDRHPYIAYDPNKCVLCARCIRTCARVLPIAALGLVNRGFQAEMRPAMADPLVETNCVSCGNCIDACPTGALTPKFPFPGRASLPVDEVETHCGFCSLACKVKVKKFGQDRYYIESGGKAGAYLCRYGRFGQELFIKRQRVTAPLLRQGDKFNEIEFSQAYQAALKGFKRLATKYGPESLAVFISPELTTEEQYLAGRIAREGFGTNNIGSLSILAAGKEAGALDDALGFTSSTADRSVLDQADLVIMNNTNVTEDHLVLSARVIEAVNERGAKLVVTNSALGDSDRALATLGLDPMRGRAAILWQGVIKHLVDDGFFKVDMVNGINGGKELLASLQHDVDTAAAIAGVEAADIAKAAKLIKSAGRVVLMHASDRVQDQAQGDIQTMGDLLLLLRAAGVEAELLLPRMHANSSGLITAGADPAFGVGRNAGANDLPGATSQEELRQLLRAGKLRGALIIGEDPMRNNRTAAFFQNLEFMVAMDWNRTETCQYADVVLPGTTYLESEGTRVNFEGFVRKFKAALGSPSGRPGWQVLAELAEAFGLGAIPAKVDELTAIVRAAVQKHHADRKACYFNEGEERDWDGKGSLLPLTAVTKSAAILPPLTNLDIYKREIQEIGTEHFRVR